MLFHHFSTRALLTLLCSYAIPCLSLDTSPTLVERQETRTVDPTTSSLQLQGGAESLVSSPTTSYRLETATAPIQLADTIGLIMPNPWSKVYVGLNYSLGFVDVMPRPAPTIGGWLRQIQPLLMLPNNRVDIFPSSGTSEVDGEGSIPEGSDGLCGFTAENYAISYPFAFTEAGWYMLIINQTMLRPSISNDHKCQNPILSQDTFFATQSFSVAPQPTDNLQGYSTPSAYTVFADVSKEMPGRLPIDPQQMTAHEKLGVGLGVAGGILAVIGMVAAIIMLRKRRRANAEWLAFSRLSDADKAAFLAENPNSHLNPNHPRNTRGLPHGINPDNRPPAPPGTMAYAQWYWSNQMRNQAQSRAGHPDMTQTQQDSAWSSALSQEQAALQARAMMEERAREQNAAQMPTNHHGRYQYDQGHGQGAQGGHGDWMKYQHHSQTGRDHNHAHPGGYTGYFQHDDPRIAHTGSLKANNDTSLRPQPHDGTIEVSPGHHVPVQLVRDENGHTVARALSPKYHRYTPQMGQVRLGYSHGI